LPLRLFLAAALCLTALAACGRRTGLDTPASLDQSFPFTEAGRQAISPPRDERGREQTVPTRPRPEPAMSSFPLDPLIP
jgi:predicted small lipoprotein YifL